MSDNTIRQAGLVEGNTFDSDNRVDGLSSRVRSDTIRSTSDAEHKKAASELAVRNLAETLATLTALNTEVTRATDAEGALSTRITDNDGDITTLQGTQGTQGTAITTLQGLVGTPTDAASDTGTLYARVAARVGDLNTLEMTVAGNTTNIATNTTNISTNTTDIGTLETSVGASGDTASATGSVYARIAQIIVDITAVETDLSTLDTEVGDPTDTASETGSIYARLASLLANIDAVEADLGDETDAAAMNGSVHAMLNWLENQVTTLDSSKQDVLTGISDVPGLVAELASKQNNLTVTVGTSGATWNAGTSTLDLSGITDELGPAPAIVDTSGAPTLATGITAAEIRTLIDVDQSGVNSAVAIVDSSGVPMLATGITAEEIRTLIGAGTGDGTVTEDPAIEVDSGMPVLHADISAEEIRTLIGAGTGDGTVTDEPAIINSSGTPTLGSGITAVELRTLIGAAHTDIVDHPAIIDTSGAPTLATGITGDEVRNLIGAQETLTDYTPDTWNAKQDALTGTSDVPGLVDALNAKEDTLTGITDVPGLQSALNAKEDTLTGISDVPGLQAALDNKADNSDIVLDTSFNSETGNLTVELGEESSVVNIPMSASPAIVESEGTPVLATGITAEEVRNTIGAQETITLNAGDSGVTFEGNVLDTSNLMAGGGGTGNGFTWVDSLEGTEVGTHQRTNLDGRGYVRADNTYVQVDGDTPTELCLAEAPTFDEDNRADSVEWRLIPTTIAGGGLYG